MRRLIRRSSRSGRERTRGQSLVEFALALPIFLLVIFGLIDLGRAVYVNNSLAEAARDGARYGSVQARSWDEDRRDDVEAWIIDRLSGVPNAVATVDCNPRNAGLGCTVEDIVVVTVQSEVEMITPIIGQILGPFSLEGRSEAVVQN
ncbi:MAG TPA: TadE/TadG family type IV pilus assembly protein [Candidatus Limnocylindria bacterium]|nr:TadE/TadG family type IV pilus assembly protein [Candidatus Limnocylindria bacterium]